MRLVVSRLLLAAMLLGMGAAVAGTVAGPTPAYSKGKDCSDSNCN